jgi:pimeloyl-ACP methyl ester carboxylesterase
VRALAAAWPEIAAGLAEGRPDVPVLFVHGEEDPVVPIDDARANVAALPQARLSAFPGDLHDVLNEHDRDVVHESVADFVTASMDLVVARV